MRTKRIIKVNNQATELLSQARAIADRGSGLRGAEALVRQALAALSSFKGGIPSDSTGYFLHAEASLLLGRIHRSLGQLRLARTWLDSAYSQFSPLLGSQGHLACIRLSECSNHLTLWAVDEARSSSGNGRDTLLRFLATQRQIYRSGLLPRESQLEHYLELTQREGDLARIASTDRQALEVVRNAQFLPCAADMWDHNHSHRLMYQALLEMRSGEMDSAYNHLEKARTLSITLSESSLRILWFEKMAELAELSGTRDDAEDWLRKARIARTLTQ